MLKTILISVWLMGLLSSSFYYFGTRPIETESGEKAKQESYKYVAVQPVTVAIFRDGEIRGYIILEISVALSGDAVDDNRIQVEYILRDRAIASLHKNKELDIHKLSKFDVTTLADKLKDDINVSLGSEAVANVLIQNINFIDKEEVRDMLLRRN